MLVVIATAERAATVTMNGQLTVLYTQDVAASPNLGTQTGFDPARLGPDWDRLTLSWAPDPRTGPSWVRRGRGLLVPQLRGL